MMSFFFFFQAEDGIRDRSPSRGLGDVYKRQAPDLSPNQSGIPASEFKERLRKRLHAEDVVPETEEDDFVDAAEEDELLQEST